MLLYAVALVAVTLLVMLYRRDRTRLRTQRAQFFDRCLDLFQSYRVTQEGPTYPLLTGRYRGHDIRGVFARQPPNRGFHWSNNYNRARLCAGPDESGRVI